MLYVPFKVKNESIPLLGICTCIAPQAKNHCVMPFEGKIDQENLQLGILTNPSRNRSLSAWLGIENSVLVLVWLLLTRRGNRSKGFSLIKMSFYDLTNLHNFVFFVDRGCTFEDLIHEEVKIDYQV